MVNLAQEQCTVTCFHGCTTVPLMQICTWELPRERSEFLHGACDRIMLMDICTWKQLLLNTGIHPKLENFTVRNANDKRQG